MWHDGDLVAVIDWETPGVSDREMDVAYCSLDLRYLGMEKVAERFIHAYREDSGETLPNLEHWESIGLCRPMPDIAKWVPTWVSMGREINEDQARAAHTKVIEDFLRRTA
jgi:aminoglycoside phosphotransferase (APT) family kinase protein